MKIELQELIGAGGGKGGAQATESPNTLRSSAIARFVEILSEGPIQGLVDGNKSIEFNKVPYENADDSINFEGVSWAFNTGEADQDALPGFSGVYTEYEIGVRVRNDKPCTYRTVGSYLDAVVVTAYFPAISRLDKENGSLLGTSVEIAIDIKSLSNPSNTWVVDKVKDVISGKQTGPYERSYRIQLPNTDPGPWLVKLRRVSDDHDNDSSIQNQTFFGRINEVVEHNIAYSDTAHIGVEIDASQFNGSASRRYDIYGKLINYPSNYDPVTREYTGVWDGTFLLGYCNNPAWVFYDLCTNPRYGLGLSTSYSDKWYLYSLAKYCDELVPDGVGGTEPRFEFNGTLKTAQDAYKVLQQVASLMRAIVFYGAGAVLTRHDAPRELTRSYSPANIIGEFKYSSTARHARHNACIVKWKNPDLGNEDDYEIYEDRPSIIKYGRNTARIDAFATRSRGQAFRQAKWLVLTELLQAETVDFLAGADSFNVLPGDLVNVSDPHWTTADYAGRLYQPEALNLITQGDMSDGEGLTGNTATLGSTIYSYDDPRIPNMVKVTCGGTDEVPYVGWATAASVNATTDYILSAFFADPGTNYVVFGGMGGASGFAVAAVDITTGKVVYKSSNLIDAGLEKYPNGVYRIWVKSKPGATAAQNVAFRFYDNVIIPSNDDGTLPSAGLCNYDGTESIKVGGFMVEVGTGKSGPSKYTLHVPASANDVVLDRNIEYLVGSSLGITYLDGDWDDVEDADGQDERPARRKIQYSSSAITAYDPFNRIVTLLTAPTSAQNDDLTPVLWVYSSSEIAPKPYVIVDVDPDDAKMQTKLTALEYSAEKFVLIDENFDITFDDTPYSNLPSTAVCPPPVNARLSVVTQRLQGAPAIGFNLAWEPPANYPYISQYLVRHKEEDGNWIELPATSTTSVQFDNLPPGGHFFEVRAVNLFSRVSLPLTTNAIIEEEIDYTRPRVSSLISDLGTAEFQDKDLKLFWLSTAPTQDTITRSIFGRFYRSGTNITVDGDGTQVVGASAGASDVSITVNSTTPTEPVITLSGTIAVDDSVTLIIGPTQFTYTATTTVVADMAEGLKALIDDDPRYSASRTGSAITVTFADDTTNATNLSAHDDPTFRRYKLEFIDPVSDDVLSTVYTTSPNYVYTYSKNAEDFGGSANRSVKVSITIETLDGNEGAATVETFTNNPPDLLVASESVIANSLLLTFSEASNDPDFAGYIVWMGTSTGFTVDDGSKVFEGRGMPLVFVDPETTYYYRYALFDAFGSNGVLVSDEETFITPAGQTYSDLVHIYKRGAGTPLPSVDTSYDHETGVLTGLDNGWTQDIPAGTTPLYRSAAPAFSPSNPTVIDPSDWATAVLEQEGTVQAHPVFLFKRTTTSTPPAVPVSTLTYTFSNGLLSGSLSGWTQAMPVSGGKYRWMITAAALAAGASTDLILSGDWSDQSPVAEDGNDLDVAFDQARIYVPINKDGSVSSYSGAVATLRILTKTGTDVTSHFQMSTASGGNPNGLTVAYGSNTVTISAGLDVGENNAPLTVSIIGKTGFDYEGVSIKRNILVAKSTYTLTVAYTENDNDRNSLTPDAPVFTVQPNVTSTHDSGNVSVAATFTYTYNNDADHKNNIDAFEVIVYASPTSESYAFDGSAPQKERRYTITHPLTGTINHNFVTDGPANYYYRFAIRAVRAVHPDVNSSGFIKSSLATTTTPFRPSASHNYTGNVGGTAASTLATVATNFTSDNDNNNVTPGTPSGITLTSAITLSGSALIKGSYTFAVSNDPTAANHIDGFLVGLYYKDSNASWSYNSTYDDDIIWREVDRNQKDVIWSHMPATKYYWLVVKPYRRVRTDINATGIIFGGTAQTTAASPHQPASTQNYTGNIDDVSASSIAEAFTNFDTDNDGNNVTPGAATSLVLGSDIDASGSALLGATFSYTLSNDPTAANNIDGFVVGLYHRDTGGSWTYNSSYDSEMLWLELDRNKRAANWAHMTAPDYYWFVVIPYRRVRTDINAAGVIFGTPAQLGSGSSHRPATSQNFTGDINSVGASTVSAAIGNFNTNNDALATTPPTATMLTDGTAVEHTANNGGVSANIVLTWGWSGSNDDIDEWEVFVRGASSGGAYSIPTSPTTDKIYKVPANSRQFVLEGVNPSLYYTLGVRPIRYVYTHINAAGVIKGAWKQPSGTGENPYQPSSTTAFNGDLTGLLNGTPVATVSGAVANFNSNNDTNGTTPGAATSPATTSALYNDSTASIIVTWAYTNSTTYNATNNIDGFMVGLYVKDTAGAYTYSSSDDAVIRWQYIEADVRGARWNGMPADKHYHAIIIPYRRVNYNVNTNGVIKASPVQAAVHNPAANPNYLGNINGVAATLIEQSATNFNENNDNNSLTPGAASGVSMSTVFYPDSTVQVQVSWTYSQSSDPANANSVDGYMVGLYIGNSAAGYTYNNDGSGDNNIRWQFVEAHVKSIKWNSMPAASWYTAIVIPYRRVITDIASTGLLKATAAQTSSVTPLRPSTASNYTGNVDSETAANVRSWANRAGLGLNAGGSVADGKVVTDSVLDEALSLSNYVAQGSTLEVGENTTGGLIIGGTDTACESGEMEVIVILPYTMEIADPVNQTVYSCSLKVGIYDVDAVSYTWAPQGVIVSEMWQSATASGVIDLPSGAVMLIYRFTGLTIGHDYEAAFQAQTMVDLSMDFTPYRYGIVRDLRALD